MSSIDIEGLVRGVLNTYPSVLALKILKELMATQPKTSQKRDMEIIESHFNLDIVKVKVIDHG